MRIVYTLLLFLGSFNLLAAERIVSLSGAITEIIYELGAGEQLVGTDTTSYFPPEAKNLPKVGYMRQISAEGIIALNPTLIIATTKVGPKAAIKQLETSGIKVVTLDSEYQLETITRRIETIAQLLSVPKKGEALIQRFQANRAKLDALLAKQKDKPKGIFIMQHSANSILVAGKQTAADFMIRLSGAINASSAYSGYKPFNQEMMIVYNPDFIMTTHEVLAQFNDLSDLLAMPGIRKTNAAKNKCVVLMDSLSVLDLGVRTVQSAINIHHQFCNPASK